MEKKNPVGVTICGWLFVFLGTISFIYHTLSWLVIELDLMAVFPPLIIPFGKRVPGAITNPFLSIYFILLILSGFGLLKLNNLYRKLMILLSLFPISYILMLVSISTANIYFNPWITSYHWFGKTIKISLWDRLLAYLIVLGMCLPSLGTIFYLTRPKVKEQFK